MWWRTPTPRQGGRCGGGARRSADPGGNSRTSVGGEPDPPVAIADGELEQLERAVHLPSAERTTAMNRCGTSLSLHTGLEFGEAAPGLLDASRTGQRPGVVAEIERSAAG